MKIRGAWRLQKALAQLNQRGIILMYHRVLDLDFDPRQLCVSPKNFEAHMKVIKKYGRPVRVKDMGENLKQRSLGCKEVAITFDDGYEDNFLNAWPILERYNIPATFFISTGTIQSRKEFWWNDLERAILAPQALSEIFKAEIRGTKYSWNILKEGPCRKINYSQTPQGVPENSATLTRGQFYSVILRILSGLNKLAREEALQKIVAWSGQSLALRLDSIAMTAEQVVTLSKSRLFEIGAHTIDHPMLSCLPPEEQEEEILNNKRDLESMTGSQITSFSYPHGDYNDDIIKLVSRLGFKNACTVDEVSVTRGMNPLLLPRFMVMNWTGEQFESKLKQWLRGDI
ncbi:MAG: polysaccharide deacetylase family protein [bacterium]|nr:polysaccharide deacetylase family protein [bacterium]MDD5354856.1 polysaccharide deacetylase family protein [bacterium]MDD5757133.1 polysaccharide deacetylase family protein [bacterium]